MTKDQKKVSQDVADDVPQEQSLLSSARMGKGALVGAAVGAFVMLAVVRIGGTLGWHPARESTWLLLGAFLGSLALSLERYDSAGAKLTGRPSDGNPRIAALNIGVALLGMLVLTLMVLGLSSLLGAWLFGQ